MLVKIGNALIRESSINAMVLGRWYGSWGVQIFFLPEVADRQDYRWTFYEATEDGPLDDAYCDAVGLYEQWQERARLVANTNAERGALREARTWYGNSEVSDAR